MTRHANRLYVTAAIRLLSDCGTYRCVRYPAAVAAGMTISKSGVIRNAPLAMRLRADNVWGCWSSSLTARSLLCSACNCGDLAGVGD